MKRVLVALAAFALAACESAGPTLFNDAEVTADVAASAGEAIAASVAEMIANQSAGGLPAIISNNPSDANAVSFTRTRTCYDATDGGAVVAQCSPISSVRRIVTNVTAEGDRTVERRRQDGTTGTFTGKVHRAASDTLRRTFTSGSETSRSHSGYATGNDTTTFVDGDFTRLVAEATRDTTKTIVFNLPRSSNPWPASGSIVRVANVKVTLTRGELTESRQLSRTVTVTFPADAQGNVALTINGRECSLNLVTRRVTNCEE